MKIRDYNLGEYYIPPNISGTCIDVGANVGSFIVKTFNLFTTFHYYEPFSGNFQRCEEKSSTLDNVTGFKEAVFSTDGDIVELLVPRSGDCGSIAVDSLDIEIRDQNWSEKKFPEKVVTVSLETMIERIGGYVNYMKIDCETSEYSLLIGKELSSIGIISMELHTQLGKDRCDELTNYIMKTHTLVRGNSKYIGWASNQHQMLYFENNNLIQREKDKAAKKELQKKIGLFSKLSDQCLVCQKDFDKKNKDMVMSWSVVIQEENVRLYCPECWEKANKLIKEIKDGYASSKADV